MTLVWWAGAKKIVWAIHQIAQRTDARARKLELFIDIIKELICYNVFKLSEHTFDLRNDCTAIGRLAGQEGTDVYCHRKCLRYPSNCPKDECKCIEKIDPKDPSIVLDRSAINLNKDFVTNYTNENGHKVEEFDDHGDKFKIISVY